MIDGYQVDQMKNYIKSLELNNYAMQEDLNRKQLQIDLLEHDLENKESLINTMKKVIINELEENGKI